MDKSLTHTHRACETSIHTAFDREPGRASQTDQLQVAWGYANVKTSAEQAPIGFDSLFDPNLTLTLTDGELCQRRNARTRCSVG